MPNLHKLQDIPLVSCCLHLWSCLDCFFCKYLYILSLFIAPFIKNKITYLINRQMQEQNENTNLFFEEKKYEISCYNLLLLRLFVYSKQWVVHNPRKKTLSLEFLDYVLPINLYLDKKMLCLTVCVHGLENSWRSLLHRAFNLGQITFAKVGLVIKVLLRQVNKCQFSYH